MLRSALSILFALSSALAAAAESRPMSEMHGGCDDYAWSMVREFNLIGVSPVALQGLAKRHDDSRTVPLDRHVDLTLAPAAEVELLAKPGREPATGGYAGLLPLRVPRLATYRISTNQRLWIDVIGSEGLVKSTKFEMQAKCEKLVKSVAFRLGQDSLYWIQLTGSPERQVVLLITLDR